MKTGKAGFHRAALSALAAFLAVLLAASNPAQAAGLAQAFHCDNASKPLSIKDYTGKNQPMHPKTLYFPNRWHGYKYWMSYTPYPGSDSRYENPSIAVSNDGVKWTTPKGLKNPVIRAPKDARHGGHNSDPQLVMVGGVMQLWYRYNPAASSHGNQPNNNVNIIYRVTSKNGVSWSKPKVVFNDSNDYMSPDILYVNGVYEVWFTNYDGLMYYRQSADLKNWTAAQAVSINLPGYRVWHQDMILSDKGYETVFCAYPDGGSTTNQCLYYAVSADGLSFSEPQRILSPSTSPTALDNQTIYRSSLVYVDGTEEVFYSAMDTKGQWHIFETPLVS